MATATQYYHGIFTPPSSPSNVISQGVVADVTGSSAPSTAASVTYTPMSTTGVDTVFIAGEPLTVTYNTSATQTVTDAKAILAGTGSAGLVGTVSKLFTVSGTTTLVLTAKAPGTAGEGIPVTKANVSGATGSLNRNFTAGADRWFGQGVGAGNVDGVPVGGLGALCTGIGYGTQMDPVAARTSSFTSTTAAASTYTPPTTGTDTIFVNGIQFTVTFDTDATTTVSDLKTALAACPQVAKAVTATGTTTCVITANDAGTWGNWIQVVSTGQNGASFSATPFLTGGAGPTVNSIASYQVGSGLDVQSSAAFTAQRIVPSYTATQGDTAAGTVQAVGATDAVLVAATATYTPPTSATDTLFINGYALTVTYNTSATQTVTDTKALIAAIPWLNNLLDCTGTTTLVMTRRTRDAYSAPGTPVNGLGPFGNAVTVFSAAANGASINHTNLTGGATSGKGVRLVQSTGTVANGGAVISGWLNEFNPGGASPDQTFPNPNPNTGSIATGFVVVGRAS
jgi:hypothetical protein